MEKQVTTTAADLENMKAPAKVTISLSSFKDKLTKEVREFISIRLANPFPDDPDVSDFSLTTKWERALDLFRYNAKKYLRTHDDIELNGVIRPVVYNHEKLKKTITYIGIFVPDPFRAEHELELSVKGEGPRTLFSVLFRDLWNLYDVVIPNNAEPDEDAAAG